MHTSVVARRSAIRITVALTLCISILLVQNAALFLTNASAQGQKGSFNREGRPRPGKPEGNLPDLEEVQNESTTEREPAPPIHPPTRLTPAVATITTP